jgi:hypothetical protein
LRGHDGGFIAFHLDEIFGETTQQQSLVLRRSHLEHGELFRGKERNGGKPVRDGAEKGRVHPTVETIQ